MIAAAQAGQALHLIGLLIVIGCVIAAAVAGFRQLWIACGLLLAVAIIAYYLLV